MKRKLSFSNMTFRFALFLALVSVFPLLVLGVTSYNTSRSVIQKDVGNYTLALMVEQKNYLELILEQVESLISNVSGVEDIRNALDDEGQYDPDDTYTRLATHAQIGYILSSYVSLKGLVSIDIFTPGGAHYHVGDTLNVQEINQDVLDRIYAQALAADELVSWMGVEDNVNANSTHSKVVTAAKLLGEVDVGSFQEKKAAILLVNYGTSSLHDHFSRLDLGEGAYMMIVDTKSRLIFHSDERLVGSQVSPAFLAQLTADEGSFVTEVEGQEMFVTYSKSDVSGWSLISLVPLGNLTASADTILNITLLVLIVSFVFIALIAVNFSRTMVDPIKRITELFKQIQAGTFDWQMRLAEKRSDEIGDLFLWFNTFLDSLEARRQADRERVRAEEELRESESLYHSLVESLPQNVFRKDMAGRFTFANKQFCETQGKALSEIISKTDFEIYPPELAEKYLADDRQVVKTGEIFETVETHQPFGKERLHVQVVKIPVYDAAGQVAGIQGIFWDITEQVRAQEQIRVSLREKETLLQEIHHRVKNNLAIVSSLLQFQAEITPDEQVRAAFQESQNRIWAMARIHEHLYRSPDLARIDMASYVWGVVDHLCQSYQANTIALQVDVTDVELDIDRALPCGLIINELVSNSFKHAFPRSTEPATSSGESAHERPGWQSEPRVRVGLRLDDGGRCELTVSDNGAGLPAGLQIEGVGRESLGLRLVNLLSRQLEGNLQVYREGGTTFGLVFPMPEERSPDDDE